MGRLSEDMRLGSMTTTQGFGYYVFPDGATCAVGAIAVARGIEIDIEPESAFVAMCREIQSLTHQQPCPQCGKTQFSLVVHLNDDHRWTREAIADYLKGLEDGQPERAAACAEVLRVRRVAPVNSTRAARARVAL